MASAKPLKKYLQTLAEKKLYTLDFSEWLGDGETIVDAECTEVAPTSDGTPLVVSGLVIETPLVTFFVEGGEHEVDYEALLLATTSLGQRKEVSLIFQVRDHIP